jgi:hypothetical protein
LKSLCYLLSIAAGFNQRIGMNKLIGFSQNGHYILAKADDYSEISDSVG